MARINVDDSIYRDSRFMDLCVQLGGMEVALGSLILAWDMAHRFARSPSGYIPQAEWSKLKHGQAIQSVGLAEVRDGGVYVKGSSEKCKFIRERSEKAAEIGRVGGLKSQEKRRSKAKQSVAKTTFSSSSSFSNSEEYSVGQTAPEAQLPAVKNPVGLFIATYVKAYQARYGDKARPNLLGKTQGQVKRFLGEVPIQRACDLIQVYCQMEGDRGWFQTKRHDFTTFLENLNPVSLALDTGQQSPDHAPVDFVAMLERAGEA